MKAHLWKTFGKRIKSNSSRFATYYTFGLICLAMTLGASTFKSSVIPTAVDANELLGTWQIDLRPSPNDPPYYQELVVTSVEGDKFTGTFYNSPIKQGKINTTWGVVSFAFITSDGSGAYNTSGQLKNGKVEGATHSLGRDFLMPWRGEKITRQK
jgi:hypothetical protein